MRNLWWAVALAAGAAGYLLGRSTAPPASERKARAPAIAPEPVRARKSTVARRTPDETSATESAKDPRRFEELFEPKTTGPVIDGTAWKPDEALADGTVLRFPPGAHVWRVSSLQHWPRFPRDLSVEGAGMDETLVRLDEIRTRDEIRNLTFRDMTIDCGNRSLTDLWDKPASIRLERCRVIRFDNGAGGSVMLDGMSAAFYATDSRIEGGFGRAPGFGNLFRVRSGLVVRMERCTIRGPLRSIYDADGEAAYVFLSCSFEELDASLRPLVERPAHGVAFEGCRFSFVEPGTARERAVRTLRELNPDWAPE